MMLIQSGGGGGGSGFPDDVIFIDEMHYLFSSPQEPVHCLF